MAVNSVQRGPGRLISSALFFAIVVASFGPVSAQAPTDVLTRLRSLPPGMQTNALRRYLYFYEPRAYPNQQIPAGAMERARRDHEQKFGPIRPQQPAPGSPQFAQTQWTAIGPNQISTSPTTSGRINSIAIDPTNTNIIYIGAATGGVWKTINGGTSWTPLTDTQCSLAMGSIAIEHSNSQIIYAGTGEENFSLDSYYGCGILKSTNGGASWTQIGASVFDTASGGAKIGKIVIHPTSTNTLLVASDFGLYRSTDGGANFTLVLSGTATDVVIDPSNPSIMYAALGNIFGDAANGVYKSTDSGASFPTKLTTGFASSNVGRIGLGLAPAAPGTIYATVQNSSTFGLLGIWKTTNGGTNWGQISATGAFCSTQCWYDMYITVHPTDATANTVYFGGLSLYKSTNGGSSFTDIGATIHVDHHAFAFLPGTPTTIFSGNDGGLFKSTNSGTSWTSLNTSLAITQFYSGFSIHPSDANIGLGGTQDNHTLQYTGSATWAPVIFSGVGGCDGGFTVIDQATPTTQYAECQWSPGAFYSGPRRSDSGGSFVVKVSGITTSESALFIPPLVGSPSSATTLYFGTTRVYKTTDRGENWAGSGTTLVSGFSPGVTAIAQAPSDANVIYAAANNGAGVFKSANGNGTYTPINTGLPNRTPTYIVVHPTDANTAFVMFSGFGGGHVFKTTNGGTSWSNISGNLPDIPVNAIVLDPAAPTTEILVGTDLGVYRTHDGGTTWTVFNTGLPNVPVLDLTYNATTGVLAAATHGRGVFKATLGTVVVATHDFDGEGKSDIAFRQSGGMAAAWLMNAAQVVQAGSFGVVSTSWALVGQRDFNGDAKHDWLWRDGNTGTVAIWLLNGLQVSQSGSLGAVAANWVIAGAADFNGDGKGDILWRDGNTGTVAIWLLNGLQVSQSGSLGTVPTTWVIAGTGDFNGDGKADILWRDGNTGTVAIWLLNGLQVSQSGSLGVVPVNWVIAETGDFNGDGKSDILWRDTNTGAVAIWFLNGLQVSQSASVATVGLDWTIQGLNAD